MFSSTLGLNRFSSLYTAECPTEREKSRKKIVSNHIQLLINTFEQSGKVEESRNSHFFNWLCGIILDKVIFYVYIHRTDVVLDVSVKKSQR